MWKLLAHCAYIGWAKVDPAPVSAAPLKPLPLVPPLLPLPELDPHAAATTAAVASPAAILANLLIEPPPSFACPVPAASNGASRAGEVVGPEDGKIRSTSGP